VAITASQARRELFPLIKRVNDDQDVVEIVSKHGNAVLMSEATYRSWRETAYLLASPANARRLRESVEAARRGEVERHDLIAPE
jgi:antitoxin YefM